MTNLPAVISGALVRVPETVGILGDISRVPVDALITPINSEGCWFGALDGVIQRNAGGQFHSQAQAAMPLTDGQTVVARKQRNHNGAFGDVVFVIDDLRQPLRQIVLAGLKAAAAAGYKTVSLPAMRTGVMLGVVEKTAQQAVEELVEGVREFLKGNVGSIEKIVFVVYNDQRTLGLLTGSVKSLPAPK